MRWVTLVVALLCFCAAAATGLSLVESERTGVAFYAEKPGKESLGVERVTRDGEPEKFGEAIGVLGFRTMLFGIIGLVSFSFHRRLSK